MPKLSLSHTELKSSADLKKSMKDENGENEDSYSLNKSLIAELIKLQERQTELSAAIAYQQRINTLPMHEPTTFSRD